MEYGDFTKLAFAEEAQTAAFVDWPEFENTYVQIYDCATLISPRDIGVKKETVLLADWLTFEQDARVDEVVSAKENNGDEVADAEI